MPPFDTKLPAGFWSYPVICLTSFSPQQAPPLFLTRACWPGASSHATTDEGSVLLARNLTSLLTPLGHIPNGQRGARLAYFFKTARLFAFIYVLLLVRPWIVQACHYSGGGGYLYGNQNLRWTQNPRVSLCLRTTFGSECYVPT